MADLREEDDVGSAQVNGRLLPYLQNHVPNLDLDIEKGFLADFERSQFSWNPRTVRGDLTLENLVELAPSGRSDSALARKFGPSANSLHQRS